MGWIKFCVKGKVWYEWYQSFWRQPPIKSPTCKSRWRATAKISTPRAGLWMPNVNVLPSRNLWLIFKDLSMQRHENHQNNIGINNVEIDLAVFKSVYYKCAESSSPSDIYFPHFSIRNQPLSCHSFFIYKDYDATL